MSFNLDSKTNEYVLKLATPQDKFPFIVGFYEDPDHEGEVLTFGKIEVDVLDGSIHDSDGCEKSMTLELDYNNCTATIKTLPSDKEFWSGTEKSYHIGRLGYYEDLFKEIFNENFLDYFLDTYDGFDEVALFPQSHILEYHKSLHEKTFPSLSKKSKLKP